MRKSSVLTGILLLLLMLDAFRLIWQKIPPFERGTHSSVVSAQPIAPRGTSPHVGSCPVFPPDNVWNTPIDKLPKDPQSGAYIASIGAGNPVHPDFGSDLNYGIPYAEAPVGTKRVKVNFDYRDDSDLGNYPIPPNAPVEGGNNSTGDRHVILFDPRRCLLYELYSAHRQPDGSWNAGSGIKMDLTGNALRAADKTSADAAGLPILPGLVRYDEVAAGHIDHALRFTVPHTRNAYIWPARHLASRDGNPNLPPMGQRFRLRADFDLSGYSRADQVIMTALKRYGMFLADNGGPMFITGVPDKRWNDTDLHALNGMKASDFEAIDESAWQMLPDSARVDPVP